MRLFLLTVAGWLTIASVAVAQEDETLWRQGVELRREGRDAEALATFERAHEQTGTRRTLAQIALAEQALGRWGAAALHLDRSLAEPDAWVTEHRAVLEQARAEIAAHVGQLEVLVSRPGAQVAVDGTIVGTSPLPGPVPATVGTVAVRVMFDGAVVGERSTVIRAGTLARESIQVVGSGPAEPSASGGGGGSVLAPVGWVLLGTGLASAVGMSIAWAIREDNAATFNSDACYDEPGLTREEQCSGEQSTVDAAQAAAIALGVGAGALVVGGVVLIAVGSSGGGGERATLDCVPTAGATAAGVVCGGRF